jgi:hypothetical protein
LVGALVAGQWWYFWLYGGGFREPQNTLDVVKGLADSPIWFVIAIFFAVFVLAIVIANVLPSSHHPFHHPCQTSTSHVRSAHLIFSLIC